jgi:hypothetical protein
LSLKGTQSVAGGNAPESEGLGPDPERVERIPEVNATLNAPLQGADLLFAIVPGAARKAACPGYLMPRLRRWLNVASLRTVGYRSAHRRLRNQQQLSTGLSAFEISMSLLGLSKRVGFMYAQF